MTIELFRNDSYLKEHNTIISEIVPEGLILNETIFYPEGGGQPGDEGSITIDNQTINKLFDSITPEIINDISMKEDFDFHTSSIIKLLGIKGSFNAAQLLISGELKKLITHHG